MLMSTAGESAGPGPAKISVGPTSGPGAGPPVTRLAKTLLPAVHTIARRLASVAAITASVAPAAMPLSTCSGGRNWPPLKRERKTCGVPPTRLR